MSERHELSGACGQYCPAWLIRKGVIATDEKRQELERFKEAKKALPRLAIGQRLALGSDISELSGELREREKLNGSMTMEDVEDCDGPLVENVYGEGELSEDVLIRQRHCGAYLLSRGIDIADTNYTLLATE